MKTPHLRNTLRCRTLSYRLYLVLVNMDFLRVNYKPKEYQAASHEAASSS